MMPRVQPITPSRRKEPFDHSDWLFDVKYDGFRAVCYLQRGRCNLISWRGNVFTQFDDLGDQLAAALRQVADLDEAILDGEVVVTDTTGRPQFSDLLRRAGSPSFVAFDILWLNGADLRALPLSERRRRAHDIAGFTDDRRGGFGRASWARALRVDVRPRPRRDCRAKRLPDPYHPRVQWLKIKNPDYSQSVRRRDLFDKPSRPVRATTP
jgi:ATP-dependent DNA ligase